MTKNGSALHFWGGALLRARSSEHQDLCWDPWDHVWARQFCPTGKHGAQQVDVHLGAVGARAICPWVTSGVPIAPLVSCAFQSAIARYAQLKGKFRTPKWVSKCNQNSRHIDSQPRRGGRQATTTPTAISTSLNNVKFAEIPLQCSRKCSLSINTGYLVPCWHN
jgi:hypothetical protein